jgi:hypothetical protein
MNRRQFIGASAASAAAAGTIGIEGCNASQWIGVVLADLPTILQIITSIMSMAGQASPANISEVQAYGTEASNDLKLVQTLVAQYKTAASTSLLSQIDAALNTAEANLTAILNAFHVSNPTLQAAVSAGLGSAITIVLSIEALLPKPPAPAAAANVVTGPKLPSHEQIHGTKNGVEVATVAFNLLVPPQFHI